MQDDEALKFYFARNRGQVLEVYQTDCDGSKWREFYNLPDSFAEFSAFLDKKHDNAEGPIYFTFVDRHESMTVHDIY